MSLKWWTGNSSKPKLPKGKVLLASMLSLALILTSGCSLLPKEAEEEVLPTINPPKLSKKPEHVVEKKTLEIPVKGVGRVMALKEEELSFTQDNKKVKAVHVQSGDQVEAGQLIAELDIADLESELRVKRLEKKKAELAMKESFRNGEKTNEQLEQEKLDLEMMLEKITEMEQTVSEAKIVAPYAGTMFGVYVQKGDTSKAYQPVAVIADLNELTIGVTISNAEDLKQITLGMEATVSINSVGKVQGKVKQLPIPKSENNNDGNNGGGGSDKESITDYLIIELDQMPEGITRGTPLDATFIVQRIEDAIVIPPSALRTSGGRNYVQIVDKDGNKQEVDVEVGIQQPTEVQIIKGLSAGQKVVGK
jgi:membrane fusion protein, macrolide-specific efflux system